VAVPNGETGDILCGEELREKLMDWRPVEDSGLTFGLFARLTMLWLFVLPFRAGGLIACAGELSARAGGLNARAASGLTVRIVLLKGFGYTEYFEKRFLRIAMSDSLPWRTVGGGAASESSSSIDGPVIISCSSSLGSQLWALPPLGALRSPLFGALLAGVRLDVCSLMPFGMPFGGAGTGSPTGG
jgi:hypothetical protein